MCELFNWQASAIPSKPKTNKAGDHGQWINEIREAVSLLSGTGRVGLRAVAKPGKELSISRPSAFKWAIAGEVGKIKRAAVESRTSSAPSALAAALQSGSYVKPSQLRTKA